MATAAAAVTLSLTALPAGTKGIDLAFRFAVLCLFVALFVLKMIQNDSEDDNRFIRFLLVCVAAALNFFFIFWLIFLVAMHLWKALAEYLERVRQARLEQRLKHRPKEVWEMATVAKHLLGPKLPPGALFPKAAQKLTEEARGAGSLRTGLEKMVVSSHQKMKALITYDTATDELILGVELGNYVTDTRISSYARRQLAKLGPFLTEEERHYVSLSLHDALMYVIDACDTNEIPCSLLEMLVRLTFTWHHQRLDRARRRAEAERLEKIRGGLQNSNAALGVEGTAAPEPDFHVKSLVDQLFDDRIFERGITAADFQAQLQRIAVMPKQEIKELVSDFLQASKFYAQKKKKEL